MTSTQTRTQHGITRQRISEVHTETRQVRAEATSLSENESGGKPLAAFEAVPAPRPLPLTWD